MDQVHTGSKLDIFAKGEATLAARARFEEAVGLRYGLLFGCMLVLVAWGVDAFELAARSADLFWPKLLLAAVTVIPLCTAAGALASRAQGAFLRKLLVWSIAGAITGWLAVHLPFEGVSAVAAALDPAVRGMAVFRFTAGMQERMIPVMLLGGVAGLFAAALQSVATGWAWDRSSSDNRVSVGGWVALLVSAPVALGLGALYDGAANAQLRAPFYLTNRVVQLALHTPPDLDLQTMETGRLLDYVASSRWRSQFTANYAEHLADFDPKTLKVAQVDVEFDNGFIWRCETLRNGESLAACLDVGDTYRGWIGDFLATGAIHCQDCSVRIEPSAADWWSKQQGGLAALQKAFVVHHYGGIVVVQALLADGSRVECRFIGADPATLYECKKA